MNSFNRRNFLRTTAAGITGAVISHPSIAAVAAAPDSGKKLITRKLGKTGIELPVVSMGVMRADEPALVRSAYEAGLRHFDTAHGYQKGKNEEMIGQTLKDFPRESFILGTKISPEDRDKKTGMPGPSVTKEWFLERLDVSLERLQMKYVDILYFHNVTNRDTAFFQPVVDALKEAKARGKARFIGLSTHRNEPESISAAIESGFYDVVLTSVNFKQSHIAEVKKAIANAAEAGIGIIAMKTMAGGYFDKEKTKPVNCKAALKWVMNDPNIGTSVPGIVNFDQLKENATVNEDLVMTEQEKNDLGTGKLEGGMYCNGCEQCLHGCRKGLPVPDMMRAYMYTYGYGDASLGYQTLSQLKVRENPCGNCGVCTVECSKGFDVAEKIRDISRLSNVPEEFLA